MPKPWSTAADLQYFPTPPCPHCAANAPLSLEHVTPPPLLTRSVARLTVEASANSVLITVDGALERLTTISARGLQTDICFADSEADIPR